MEHLDLLSNFQQNDNDYSPWSNDQENKPTPEETDQERLEQSIKETLENKQLLNKALSTFLTVFAINTGISGLTALGIGAITSGGLGCIVVGIFLVNTLTKLDYDNRIHINKNFVAASAQTIGVSLALWNALEEQRTVAHHTKTGKEKFYQEVREYELKPTPPTYNFWFIFAAVGIAILWFISVLRSRSNETRI